MPQSRRDFMRVSAILAGASATGIRSVAASPAVRAPAVRREQDDIETGVRLPLPFNPYGEEIVLDPHRAPNWGPFWVMLPYAWSGLLRFDENGAVEPDLAESVTPNEDGTVWTATLREGIAYANGDPVLADHFIHSWHRALNHMRLAPMASFIADVAGYDDIISGSGGRLGVEAIDDRTIEITLSRPVSHFTSSLATFVWAVVNPAYTDPDEGVEPDLAAASAGPWTIVEENDGSRILMEPNDHYWDEPSPSVTSIEWIVLPGAGTDQAALDLYEANEIAVADVPVSLLDQVRETDALAEDLVELEDHSSVMAITMDFHQEPFDDVRVRRAIAASIDRDRWADEIQRGAFVPATSFTPPVLQTIANYDAPSLPAFARDDAKDLLDDAGVNLEEMDTGIIYFQPATDSPEQMEAARSLLDMIQDATGLEVTHDTSLTREQITALRQDNGGLQFDVVQWWLASNTPSILKLAASQESPYNAGWINWEPELEETGDFTPGEDAERFDKLVTAAEAELDEGARNDLYREAEELLLRNAVYVPLGFWIQRFVQQPWLQGTRQGPWSGNTPVRIDKDVIVAGRPSTPDA